MRAIIAAVILLAVQTPAIAADPTATWQGVEVLPKLFAVVKIGDETIDCTNEGVSFPWIVQDVDGEWLWVGNRKKGWVQRSQVVTLDEAADYYTQFIKRSSYEAWAYGMRAVAYYRNGDLNSAIADFGVAVRLSPTAATYSNRGLAHLKKQDYDNAIADFAEAVRLDQNGPDYNEAIHLDPTYALAYIGRAIAWADKHDYEKAIADYNEAIRFDPNSAIAYYNRGRAWFDNKDYDKAVADFDKAIHFDPTFAAPYIGRGLIWRCKNDYNKAITDYGQALRLDPKETWSYINRGAAWSHKKDYDKAIADYNEAIRLDPNATYAFNNAAWLRATCTDERYRNGEKAVALATKACELSGWKDADCCGTLGAAYAEAGDFDSAIKYQNKAIDLKPTDDEFLKEAKGRLELYKDQKPYRDNEE